MANLDRLMGLSGATAAGEFTAGGDLVTYKGDLPEDIAKEKAMWVLSIADHMPFKVMAPMCQLLINHSELEAEHPDLSFEL